MRKISKKIFIMFIIIIFFIHIASPLVFAGLADAARGESGYQPPPPTPADDPMPPTTNPGTQPEDNGDIVETNYYYEKISGNVWEDLGYTLPGTKSNSDDAKQKMPINGVTVLLKQGDQVVSTYVTDSSGYYEFTPGAGTYSTEFVYGKIDGNIDLNNVQLIKNVLKYNGHDYITEQVPQGETYIDVERLEIQQSGKGSAQVFIALDCSYGMRTTKVMLNGEETTRLKIAVDSAKKLVDELIDSNENIYVGLVFFSGTNYRAVSLTKNKLVLKAALDEINSNGWQTPNTNILGALQKAKDSFYNNDKENSNRYIAILSDGIPTSNGSTEVYRNDSDETVLNKLYNVIAPSTKNKVNELKQDGIKIISLFARSDDNEENELVRSIFKDTSNVFGSIQDGQQMIDTITKEIKKYLISSTQAKEYVSERTVISGYEDATRRAEVDKNFETLWYSNTILFDLINNYDASEESKQKAVTLSNATYMYVLGGKGYAINPMPGGLSNPAISYFTDPDTGKQRRKITYNVRAEYSGQDMVLAKRPAFALATTTTATGLKVTLADKSVLDIQLQDVGSDIPIIQVMDEELAHGATIQIEYTVKIKNDSSIQCNYLELIDYLPAGLVLSQDMKLLTENKTNKDYGWAEVSLEELYNKGYIPEETLNTYRNVKAIRIVLDNNGKGKDGFYIAPGGEYNVKFTVSKLISSLNDVTSINVNVAEVLVYKNSANRRMAYKQLVSTQGYNIELLKGVYPGDNKDQDCSTYTNLVFILPPTGLKRNIAWPIIAIIILLTTYLISKKVLKKHYKS